MMSQVQKTTPVLSHTARIVLLASFVFPIVLGGCTSPKGDTVLEKRAYVQNMRAKTLRHLYKIKPETEQEIRDAPGYAVFAASQAQVIITSMGNGFGIIHDNETHKDTYMAAFGFGAGLGIGAQKHHIVVIFNDKEIMNEMIEKGWTFGTSATAAAKLKEGQDAATHSAPATDRMTAYSFTDTGIMLGVSLRGSKIWKDKNLNW